MTTIHGYHAHIYFDAASRTSADSLRKKILMNLAAQVRVHHLIDEPIGPHPLPMFEVDVPKQNIDTVFSWLEANHGVHSILVHPITGDDLADHRDNPRWIGKALPLDLEFLERIQRR